MDFWPEVQSHVFDAIEGLFPQTAEDSQIDKVAETATVAMRAKLAELFGLAVP